MRVLICLGAGVVLLLLNATGSADVWERKPDGELELHRSLDHFQREQLASDWRPPSPSELAKRRVLYRGLIEEIAARYGVDARLVHAIIEVESAYDRYAVSKSDAIGLMQLIPKTVERFGVVDPLDPRQNINAGARYLRLLFREFQETELVLAAYNAGEEAVRKYHRAVPPYAETEEYIRRVLIVLDRNEFNE